VSLFGLGRFDLHRGLFGCLKDGYSVAESVERGLAEQVDLLPANVWSHEEESVYEAHVERDPLCLRALLAPVREDHDYVLVDAPPALGPLTRAALAAADGYLVPVQAEALNLATLPRLRALADEVRSLHNPALRFEGYVITMADTRTRHAQEVIEELARDQAHDLLQTVIPRSVRVAEEGRRGRPTVQSRPGSAAGRAFQRLAEEILSRDARERAATHESGEDAPGAGAPADPSRFAITPEEEAAVRELLRAAMHLPRGVGEGSPENG
jgi:chromosome partitioning protein